MRHGEVGIVKAEGLDEEIQRHQNVQCDLIRALGDVTNEEVGCQTVIKTYACIECQTVNGEDESDSAADDMLIMNEQNDDQRQAS